MMKHRKRLTQRIYEEMELPDIASDLHYVSLDRVLDSTTIPRLQWDDIQVLQVIGKGASGVVSKGVYKG